MSTDPSAAPPTRLTLLRAIPARLKRHNIVVTAAGIAFYGVLALVPTLVATISIYGLANEGNEEQIRDQIEDAAGSLDQTTKDFVVELLQEITTSDGNLVALILSVALALFSASGAVQKLMNTIGVAYEAIENRPGWRVRLLAYLFTLVAIVGVVLMVGVIGVIPAVLAEVNLGRPAEAAIQIGRLPLFTLLFVGALTTLYRYAPDREPRTPWRNPGAWVAAVTWMLIAVGFSFYFGSVGRMPASYSVLGTLAVLMIFFQLTAIAIIVGAEYNAEREEQLGQGSPAAEIISVASPPAVEPLSLGKAVAGLAALFVFGRSSD